MNTKHTVDISVIVAVYNSAKYLRKCLDSIASQTVENIEIICINDGSTDDSADILREYAVKDNRFRVYDKENEGAGGASARNMGLEQARGKYISILDSDDFFELNMLEKAMIRGEETGADIVVFGGFEYDERNGNTYKVASILNEEAIPDREIFSYRDCANNIYQLSQGMAWNKLYRRTFLEKHNLKFQKIKYTDDAYFTFAHMVLAEKITVINEPLCYYRVNSGISQTDGLADYPDSSYMPYIALKAFLVEKGIYEEVKQSFVNCAAAFMRYFYDKINRYQSYAYLHEKLRNEIFTALDMAGQDRHFFYDERVFMWICEVCDHSAEETIFRTARAYGSDTTTGILRFPFPYRMIKQESRVALIGAGIMGRHFYAQVMLSGYCDIVLWADHDNSFELSYIRPLEEIKDCQFDYVVIAYVQPHLVDMSLTLLKKMGIAKNKIILGGKTL